MHWLHGTWTIQFLDKSHGWIAGQARIDLGGLNSSDQFERIDPSRFVIRYDHPVHGPIVGQVEDAVVRGDTARIVLAADRSIQSTPIPSSGVHVLEIADGEHLRLTVGAEQIVIPVEAVVAPRTSITLTWSAATHVAEGLWQQELEDDRECLIGARSGHFDDVAAMAYGSEQWARPSPIVEAVAIVHPRHPAYYLDPSSSPAARRSRDIWIFGTGMEVDRGAEAEHPFAASGLVLLSGAERAQAITACDVTDRSDLQVASLSIGWPDNEIVSEGAHSLFIDGVKLDWPLKWAAWQPGLEIQRDASNDPAARGWRPSDRVWPSDTIQFVLREPAGAPGYTEPIDLLLEATRADGTPLADKRITIGAGVTESPAVKLRGASGDPDDLEVEPLGHLRCRFVGAPSDAGKVSVMVDEVPQVGDTRWDRQMRRAANVWNVDPADGTGIVDTSAVPLQLRDHAALLLLQYTFTHVLHGHAEAIENETLDQWRLRLEQMVRPRSVGGQVQTAPIAATPLTTPDGTSLTAAIFQQTPAQVAQAHGLDARAITRWWPTALEEARRAYLRSVRSARSQVMAIGDRDVDGLLSIAAVAGGEPAEMAAVRLVRWDATVDHVVDDLPSQAIVKTIGTVADQAQANAELEGVVLGIVGATVAVLTGGIAYFVAAPALIGGAIVVGAAVDFTLLAIDLETWSDEDWRVEVATGGATVVGADAYQRALATQTPGWLRGVAIAGTVLGPLLDGPQVFAKTAQVSKAVASQSATRVLRAADPDTALRELSHVDRIAFVKYLDDAMRLADEGVDIAQMTELQARAVRFVSQMAQGAPDAFASAPLRRLMAEVPSTGGSTLKYTATGTCASCSICMSLLWLYESVIRQNAHLADDLFELHLDLARLNRALDPALDGPLIARGVQLRNALEAAAAQITPAAVTTQDLFRIGRRAADRRAANRLVTASALIAEELATQVARGNRVLALEIMRRLSGPARIGEAETLVAIIQRSVSAEAGLLRLLRAGGDYPMIAGWLTRWQRSKVWRLGNPEDLVTLLEQIERLTPTQFDGLQTLFRVGSTQLLSGNRAREFTRALVDMAERLDDLNQAEIFASMLDIIDEVSRRSDGLARIVSMFVSATDNIFEGGLFQLMVAARRLREFGPQARVVFEVDLRPGLPRIIDLQIVDGAGPSARVLVEIETKAHNTLEYIESLGTMRQWARDIQRVADHPTRTMTSLQWSFSENILSHLGPAVTQQQLQRLFGAILEPTLPDWVRTLPGGSASLDEIIQVRNAIGPQRLAQLQLQFQNDVASILRFD